MLVEDQAQIMYTVAFTLIGPAGCIVNVDNTMKKILRRFIYAVPVLQALWFWFRDSFSRPNFSGWGMRTIVYPPWQGDRADAITSEFVAVGEEIKSLVRNKQFVLSQFDEVYDKEKLLDGLLWRHYLVYWTARYAAERTSVEVKTLVECGVCDGLTAYFAMRALSNDFRWHAHLFDAWGGMREDLLVENERLQLGNYSFLEMNRTKENLSAFASMSTFHKGYIPDVFRKMPFADQVVWLHIDLNASIPTRHSLEEYFPKMPKGGIILFDDYLGKFYPDTKVAIDDFFSDKEGMLLPVPTGQAIFFK